MYTKSWHDSAPASAMSTCNTIASTSSIRYNKNHGEGMGALRGWLVETFISHTASTICEEKVM
eukprot:6626078-Pyramimonas_sp.AAC.1